MGAPWSAYEDIVQSWLVPELQLLRDADTARIPVLGVCFGGQLLAAAHGGSVERATHPELGWYEVGSDDNDLVPGGQWFQWHYDRWRLPPGAVEIGRNPANSQAFVLGRNLAVQFHPEIDESILAGWLANDGEGEVRQAGRGSGRAAGRDPSAGGGQPAPRPPPGRRLPGRRGDPVTDAPGRWSPAAAVATRVIRGGCDDHWPVAGLGRDRHCRGPGRPAGAVRPVAPHRGSPHPPAHHAGDPRPRIRAPCSRASATSSDRAASFRRSDGVTGRFERAVGRIDQVDPFAAPRRIGLAMVQAGLVDEPSLADLPTRGATNR